MRVPIKIGEVFNFLTTIKIVSSPKKGMPTKWLCRCKCGTVKQIRSSYLRSGHTTSCGCNNSPEAIGKRSTTHGMSKTATYRIWQGMHWRCYNPKQTGFENYGGRGIIVCERWHNFENFLKDMGERPPNMTIERSDVNAEYGPFNCLWETKTAQADNTRRTIRLTFNGETKTLLAWSKEIGVPRHKLYQRYKAGQPIENILSKGKLRIGRPTRFI